MNLGVDAMPRGVVGFTVDNSDFIVLMQVRHDVAVLFRSGAGEPHPFVDDELEHLSAEPVFDVGHLILAGVDVSGLPRHFFFQPSSCTVEGGPPRLASERS